MKKIKFAIVGCGQIGKRHAAIITGNPETELAALCDILPKGELSLPAALDAVPFFENIENLLGSGIEMDVVCICTPNGLHARQALRVLDARKHVVIEKPMGLNKAECEKVIHRALNVNRQVFCVMQNRYSPPAVWIKSVIENKNLGDIYFVSVNCFWNRDDRYYRPGGVQHKWHGDKALDGGTLFTQFSHFIDMVYWLFGDLKNIRARFANFAHADSIDFEDSGVVHFELEGGALGTLSYSTAVWDQNFESSLTIVGSEGTIKIGGQYMERIEYCHVKNFAQPELPPSNPPNQYGGYIGSAANHHFVIENVLGALSGKNEITTNALEGMKTVEIIERIYGQKE